MFFMFFGKKTKPRRSSVAKSHEVLFKNKTALLIFYYAN